MKPLSIKQKQAIYEHLLTLDCPDLLAALIAERSTRYSRHGDSTTYDAIADNFAWYDTPEDSDGTEFWSGLYEELAELENTVVAPQKYEDALQEALEDDPKSPTEKDFAPKGEEVKIEIKTESYRPPQSSEYLEWQKEQIKPHSTVTYYKAGDMIISDEGVLVCQAAPNLSTKTNLFDKIKLFFGKVFYKV